MINYEETGLRILENLHKSCEISPIILVGDQLIGYQYCLVPSSTEYSVIDHELCKEMNDMISVLLDKNVVEMYDFGLFAEKNVVMSYHDFTAAGGKW